MTPQDASHTPRKSSIGRIKRVIRYDHSMYNAAPVFRESRFLSLLWFREETTPPCPPHPLRPVSHARLRFSPLVSRRGGTRGCWMFADVFHAHYRTFFGEEGGTSRVSPIVLVDHGESDRFILHIVVVMVKMRCKIRERRR